MNATLLLLPGNSPQNKSWINELAAAFQNDFARVEPWYYAHWKDSDNENLLNVQQELSLIAQHLHHNSIKETIIFAKSAGIVLALQAMHDHILNPKACIFIGFPLHWARAHRLQLESLFPSLHCPTLFIQKTHDPAASFAELSTVLKQQNIKNTSMLELPGSDHHYGDIQRLRREVLAFLKKQKLTT